MHTLCRCFCAYANKLHKRLLSSFKVVHGWWLLFSTCHAGDQQNSTPWFNIICQNRKVCLCFHYQAAAWAMWQSLCMHKAKKIMWCRGVNTPPGGTEGAISRCSFCFLLWPWLSRCVLRGKSLYDGESHVFLTWRDGGYGLQHGHRHGTPAGGHGSHPRPFRQRWRSWKRKKTPHWVSQQTLARPFYGLWWENSEMMCVDGRTYVFPEPLRLRCHKCSGGGARLIHFTYCGCDSDYVQRIRQHMTCRILGARVER